MDFNATIDLIIKDLKEASDIIDDLKKYPGVPAIQVELAKLKCRSAGEVISILKTLKETPPVSAVSEPVQQKKILPKQPIEEIKPVAENKIIDPPAKEKEPDPVIEEPVESIVIPADETPTSRITEHESSILADKFSHLSNSFNEQIGTHKNEDDISEMLKTKHLDTLSEAIGVNDKFLFIREIFNGNQNDYTLAIKRLENTDNLADARAVIMSYTGESNENEAVKQLLDLVKRKLPSNE